MKKDYKELQRWVNDGHQPWRLDANAVAAEQVLKAEGAATKQWDVYRLPLEVVQETQNLAVFTYKNATAGRCYRVTVRRFAWLLALAEKWDWMVWIPTEVACSPCAAEQAR